MEKKSKKNNHDRLLLKEDFQPNKQTLSSFTESEIIIVLIVILFVIAILFLVPVTLLRY